MKIPNLLLSKKPPVLILAISFFLVAFIGYIDYLSKYEISLAVFYSVPVLISAWFISLYVGYVFSMICILVILYTDFLVGESLKLSGIYIWNNAGIFLFYLFSSFIIAEIKKIIKREIVFSRTDSLTGIANSRFFIEETNKEIQRSKRYFHTISAVYIDCDNFKHINDEYGHATGDRLLQVIASTINENIRAADIVARVGGDEFCILMPETGIELSTSSIDVIKNSLLKVMEENNWPVTFSIGVATFIRPPESANEVLGKSDELMYHVKRNGRNNVVHRVFE
ncbi:MAG: GGDEF domain-containing protein [Bacteroidales bacterium]|nr:GGDEF domain-containing protein [Bacteroidales bacterium]